MMNSNYTTLSGKLNELRERGYTHDFNVRQNCVICHQHNGEFSPEEFKIDEVYRFEGATNPDDQAVLYAISSDKHHIKGVLVNGYGISSDSETDAVISKLRTHS